jgi:5,10-methylenetetrahydrofolate reductase
MKQNSSRWIYTVEKASGGAARALEAQLLNTPGNTGSPHQLRTVIQPDLPVANTWAGLLKKSVDLAKPRQPASAVYDTTALGVDVVQTVAVNLRRKRHLRSYLRQKVADCYQTYGQGTRIKALLCVSGGHPAKQIPLLSSALFADSADLLREASTSLRAKDDDLFLDPSTSTSSSPPPPPELWCVENPLLNFNAQRLGRKFDSGATKVVTQPPLLRGAFLDWFEQCERHQLGRMGQEEGGGGNEFVIGIPCITSTNSLLFWFEICGVKVSQSEEATSVLRNFQSKQDSLSPENFDAFCLQWTESQMELAKQLPRVGGIHFMPVTAKGYRQLMSIPLV